MPKMKPNGPRKFPFDNYHHHGDRPRFLFEDLWGKLITAVLHSGQNPKGHDHQAVVETPL